MRKESTAAMGMAASQARLLSLTARLTDNEMRSQMISNSKVRLADKTNAASKEYMESLNTTQLLYSTYDASGEKTYQSLTAGIINEYGPLKNQYGLVNTSGKIMVNGVDGANYAKSNTLQEFLECYNLYDDKNKKIPNPDWQKQAEIVYGKRYDLWVTQNNWSTVLGNDFYEDYILNNDQAGRSPGGTMGDWIDAMKERPDITPPDRDDPKYIIQDVVDNSELYDKFLLATNSCYTSAMGTRSICYLHVLAHMLDFKPNGSSINTADYPKSYTTSTGDAVSVTSGDVTGAGIYPSASGTMTEVSAKVCDTENVIMAAEDDNDTITQASSKADKLLSNYTFDAAGNKVQKTLKQKVIDLFYAVQNYSSLGISYDALKEKLKSFQGDMSKALSEPKFDEEQYQKDLDAYNKEWNEWLTKVEQKKQIYLEQLAILDGMDKFKDDPYREINDKDKAEWYTNLWYRMGGKDENHKDKDKYEVLDERLSNNADWLKFALDHGVISMEQVKTVEEDDEYAKLETKTWKSIIYSSAADITEQDNQVAITRAEVKYTKALKDIEYKDKQYDQDLKKLDTEHNAIQTEYDSLKTVIQKNQERSFKAFS